MIIYPDRPQEIYDFIIDYKIANDGLSPSIREIATACNISSTSIVDYHIGKLVDAGKIEMRSGIGKKVRGIKVVGGLWIPPERKDDK